MKVILFVFVATHLTLSSAGLIPSAPLTLANTGNSVQSQTQDSLGNYAFAYTENHATGGTSRKESGNPYGQVVGSYSLGIVDGRQRIVNYVADAHGFRAQVLTNEPGTAPTDQPQPAVALAPQPAIAYAPQPAIAVAPQATTFVAHGYPAVQSVAYPSSYSVSPYLG